MKEKELWQKTKRLHPLAALDQNVITWPRVEPPDDKDRRIEASAASPYEKCRERYAGDVPKQLDVIQTDSFRRDRVRRYLDFLEQESTQGYIVGLEELAFIAHSATQRLNRWAKRSPGYVSIIAQNYGSWPLLCMLNTPDKDEQELLQRIKLDHANIDGLATHLVDQQPNPTRLWAFRLIKALQDYRRLRTRDDLPREHFWSVRIIGGSDWEDAVPKLKTYPDLCAKCQELPAFGLATEPQWWRLAKELLLRISNNEPWTLDGLNEVANTGKVKDAMKSGQKTDGLKRDDVLKTLRSAFRTLARRKQNNPAE